MTRLKCHKKRWFENRDQAKRKINRLKQVNNHGRLEPYHCPECGGWHLTSHVSMMYKVNNRRHR